MPIFKTSSDFDYAEEVAINFQDGKEYAAEDLTELLDTFLDQIETSLSEAFPEEMASSIIYGDPDARLVLKEALLSQPNFKKYFTYGSPQAADVVLDEIVGAGIIQRILKQYPSATDIGYNGRMLTVDTADDKLIYGRSGILEIDQRFLTPDEIEQIPIVEEDYIIKLINRFAIREKKEFTEQHPIFDGFSDFIRISATHRSVSETGTTMSMRITKASLSLTVDRYPNFANPALLQLMDYNVALKHNHIISGETGTGKTELLKLLSRTIPFEQRVITVEDIAELQLPTLFPHLDVLSWIVTSKSSMMDHIIAAMRNFPQWLYVSEIRGAEAYDFMQAALSGHSGMTTVHTISNEAVPARFVGMAMMSAVHPNGSSLKDDFLRYIQNGTHITRRRFKNGQVLRYVDSFGNFDLANFQKGGSGFIPIYEARMLEGKNGMLYRLEKRYPLPKKTRKEYELALGLSEAEINNLWEPTLDDSGKVIEIEYPIFI